MKLIEIADQFVMDVGAPCPLLITDDTNLRLIFFANEETEGLRQRNNLYDEGIIEISFKTHRFFSFGPPNDEALNGHPYYELGLRSYSFYELLDSDLIARIATYSRYHPYYNPKSYEKSHHYIITFKEKIFECVAKSFEVSKYQEPIYDQGLKTLNRIYNKS